ncbi:MAG: trigger factor [Gemmatimonadales bacterium]
MPGIVVTRSSEEPGVKNLKVEVPVELVDTAEKKAASYYAKRVKLPGFRKGKVPLPVIRKKFSDAIRENVIRELVEESWKTALDQEDLQPIADPQIRDLKFEAGVPITFEMSVAVKPELELGRIGGFKIKRKIPKVTDAMVESQLEDLRRQRAPWVPVEGARPTPGQLVSVTITPLEQGEASEGKQYQIVLGEGQALPDIEERIMQMLPNEAVDAAVRFPDEISDEFAREVGDFDSAQALTAAVREDLEADARREGDAEARRQLLEEIEAANSVEAPRPLVQRVMSAFAEAYKVPDERLEKFAAEFSPVAERQVRRDLIIDHVAEKESLKATEEDVDFRIEEIAKRQNTDPSKVYSSLQKAKRLNELERSITEEKVFNYLMEQSTIVDETS